jgi:hypothetical protein
MNPIFRKGYAYPRFTEVLPEITSNRNILRTCGLDTSEKNTRSTRPVVYG